uniref:Helicase/UvrB N-terminal domain-containing protein n=1 Tax=viral metagenome TaxID=1070528 RepID=A0A6C0D264_9ZZZZ
MDLSQSKLTKSEWQTAEKKVSDNELTILKLIIQGYHNTNIRHNENMSLYSFTKIEQTEEIESYLFQKYFQEICENMIKKYANNTPLASISFANITTRLAKTLKTADTIRLQNLDNHIKVNKTLIIEFLLLDLTLQLLKHLHEMKPKYAFYLYTLLQLKKTSIQNINKHTLEFINKIIDYSNNITKTSDIIKNAYDFIERNKYLLKYEDMTLFPHQKQLFSICKLKPDQPISPKLILYAAPTGTGKTLSPLGLSEEYRIIFVCVARHIGLALAKSAISMEKKVAFAFGCETASDVRLHYFSAINYTKNRRSGGIGKVDNSVGDNVEIMICDVQSYLTAMHYMLAFNPAERIITYWDEPTITLDYQEHPLHQVIQRNWAENQIPTMVLSCATLPSDEELQPVFADFRCKFAISYTTEPQIYTIKSADCKKSIPILNKAGECVLPHYLYEDYDEIVECAEYCKANKTLLRYFDLQHIIRFIEYVNRRNFVDEELLIDTYFDANIAAITMNSLKEYYLELLLYLKAEYWPTIYTELREARRAKYDNILFTTKDAYTLTDGPTIFLAEDVDKIGTFYIQQSNIDASVFRNILSKIVRNGEIIQRIEELESMIEAKESKMVTNGSGDKEKGAARESGRLCKESETWSEEINKIRKEIRAVSLDPQYVPNTKPHQEKWTPTKAVHEQAFMANIGEEMAKEIMMLNIDNNMKVLLLLGIGVFTKEPNPAYMEIMKTLADEQRLFIIIASTDYIYGTNYQFCHGVLGKDLTNMTQQKTLQAMGRIGRNNIQQDYTVRFRDDDMIMGLFSKPDFNQEAENMCRLFTSY